MPVGAGVCRRTVSEIWSVVHTALIDLLLAFLIHSQILLRTAKNTGTLRRAISEMWYGGHSAVCDIYFLPLI